MKARHFLWLASQLCSPSALAQEAAPATESSPESFDLQAALISTDTRAFTSEEAGQRARARSPQITSAQAAAESAHWDSEVQWSAFLPTVQGQAGYIRYSQVNTSFGSFDPNALAGLNPDQQATALAIASALFGSGGGGGTRFTQPPHNYQFSATARYPVSDIFLRVWPQHSAAKNIAEAREIEVETKRATVDLTAREAFYAHARALATMLVAEQALKQAEAQAQQAKLFVDAGTAAPVDLMTATARVESMRSALARGRGAVAISRNTLATYSGVKTQEVVGIKEPVTELPEAPKEDVDTLLTRGLDHRPELRALRKLAEANGHQRIAERNGALPTVSVDGTVLYANPNPRYIPIVEEFKTTWQVGASLTWTPNQALVGYQRNKKYEAETEKVLADVAALEDAVRIEVVQAFEDYKAADAAARASESQRGAAEETYRVRLATYRVGAGVQIDLLAADLALTQARLDFVNAAIDSRIALARLARATGEPR
ncbi:MAG TPA: TolC family protein [Polyangiales bacterium]|nr:TolC family protein [Polyangiales bacterium]